MAKTIYSKEHKNLVERLIKARISCGLSQKATAERLKKSQSYISKLESGQRRVDVVELKQIAVVYKKDFKYFIM